MLYKLHYWFLASGSCAITILLGVFVAAYSDASPMEIGALYMIMPLTTIIFRPLIAAWADRNQAHQKCLMMCLFLLAASYLPFIIIPILGEPVYVDHARICWYIFVVLKIIGDVTFGGVISIGDSLAINYSKRIGTEFYVYRVWGTLSWMTFGLIVGLINEVPCLPKYVPAFIILILTSLLDMTIIWLWPREYFTMVPLDQISASKEDTDDCDGKSKATRLLTKSLMPKEVVLAQMKNKILSLIGLGAKNEVPTEDGATQEQKTNGVSTKQASGQQVVAKIDQQVASKDSTESEGIDKLTQIRILALLIRRDPRLVLYLIFFVTLGLVISPVPFFFIDLSNRCHTDGGCDFSLLTGLLQMSMAGAETILFLSMKRFRHVIGRVNLCAAVMLITTIKFSFYAIWWTQVNPWYSLISEVLSGFAFAIYLTTTTEYAYFFANEVTYLMPELIDRGIVEAGPQCEKVKLSLSATMQALIASAVDGIGRSLGALLGGLIFDLYSFETLCAVVAIGAGAMLVIILSINIADNVFKFELGLDVKAAKLKTSDVDQLRSHNKRKEVLYKGCDLLPQKGNTF